MTDKWDKLKDWLQNSPDVRYTLCGESENDDGDLEADYTASAAIRIILVKMTTLEKGEGQRAETDS